MNSILFLLIFVSQSFSEHFGKIKAQFFDFDRFIEISTAGFRNKTRDYHLTTPKPPEVSDFVINFIIPTIQKCDRAAIACIQFQNDPNYYSLSSVESWDSPINNSFINFISNTTVIATFPSSYQDTISSNIKYNLTLTINFIYSEEKDIQHSEFQLTTIISKSQYRLDIRSKILKQFVFDHFSLFCDHIKHLLAILSILCGIFLLIPVHKFYNWQFLIQHVVIILICTLIYLFSCIDLGIVESKEYMNIYWLIILMILMTVLYLLLLLFYGKNWMIQNPCALLEKYEPWRRKAQMFPFYIFILIFIYLILMYFIRLPTWSIFIIYGALVAFLYWLSTNFEPRLIKFSHSLCGSYLLIRGLSVFIGGFPDELEIGRMRESNQNMNTGRVCIYLALIIIIPFGLYFFYDQEKYSTIFKGDDGPRSSRTHQESLIVDTSGN